MVMIPYLSSAYLRFQMHSTSTHLISNPSPTALYSQMGRACKRNGKQVVGGKRQSNGESVARPSACFCCASLKPVARARVLC
jgi:hypothetical protein